MTNPFAPPASAHRPSGPGRPLAVRVAAISHGLAGLGMVVGGTPLLVLAGVWYLLPGYESDVGLEGIVLIGALVALGGATVRSARQIWRLEPGCGKAAKRLSITMGLLFPVGTVLGLVAWIALATAGCAPLFEPRVKTGA